VNDYDSEIKFQEYVKKAFALWGEDKQYLQLMEELGELSVAANHLRRGKCDIEHFKGEICDVFMMIGEFIMYHNIPEIELEEMLDRTQESFYKKVDKEIKTRELEESRKKVLETDDPTK